MRSYKRIFCTEDVIVSVCQSFRMSEWGYGGENGRF